MSGSVANGGRLSVNFSIVSSPGEADLIVSGCEMICIRTYEISTNKRFASENISAFQWGNEIRINDVLYKLGRQTLQHEVGHYLGLTPQHNAKGGEVGSIMSYSLNRSILISDRQRLYDGYWFDLRK